MLDQHPALKSSMPAPSAQVLNADDTILLTITLFVWVPYLMTVETTQPASARAATY